jgi:hypothetical protein
MLSILTAPSEYRKQIKGEFNIIDQFFIFFWGSILLCLDMVIASIHKYWKLLRCKLSLHSNTIQKGFEGMIILTRFIGIVIVSSDKH